jgi:DNA polymerase III, alpha subunit (gram-positive type)
MARGIAERRICDTPVAIIDFETTGLTPGADRVVEVAVARVDPHGDVQLVLDTLVNPMRRVSATEIHGITDADVIDAPRFADIAGELVGVLNGCVVSAYNVYFDIKFLNAELFSVGVDHEPPHICLMYLRPMLGLGSRCKLGVACQSHGIAYESTHMAAHDALAAARLLSVYLKEANRRGVGTFSELGKLKSYKFVDSFDQEPLPPPSSFKLPGWTRFCSRSKRAAAAPVDAERLALAAYWDALKTVVADLDVTDEEAAEVASERERLGLSTEQVRSLHARIYASVIQQFAADRRIDDREARQLRRLQQCLSRLGWAPGE